MPIKTKTIENLVVICPDRMEKQLFQFLLDFPAMCSSSTFVQRPELAQRHLSMLSRELVESADWCVKATEFSRCRPLQTPFWFARYQANLWRLEGTLESAVWPPYLRHAVNAGAVTVEQAREHYAASEATAEFEFSQPLKLLVEVPNQSEGEKVARAFDGQAPYRLSGSNWCFYLFGSSSWRLSKSDESANEDELRLLFLDEVDSERRKYERLRRKFSDDVDKTRNNREPIPEAVRVFVWRRDEGKCARCGSQRKLEYDHIIPVSKGGGNTARNIQLLCEECNRKKSDAI